MDQALEYVRSLASRKSSPLRAVVGGTIAPSAFRQYPHSGITWIGEELGYYYHSHGPQARPRGAHGHFHLFSQRGDCRGERTDDRYTHLIGIDVDATGQPLRLFATNHWVTAGQWRSAAHVRRELLRFAAVATRPESGPERWIGLILRLFPAQVCEVLRQREHRVRQWRRDRIAQRRFADRRIPILGGVALTVRPRER